jgi:hypothetical protein
VAKCCGNILRSLIRYAVRAKAVHTAREHKRTRIATVREVAYMRIAMICIQARLRTTTHSCKHGLRRTHCRV